MKRTTLAELGSQLPIGVMVSHDTSVERASGFGHAPMTVEQERQLDIECRRIEKRAGRALGLRRVTYAMAILLEKFGPHDFSKRKVEERVVMLDSAYAADVLYVYAHARIENLGPQIEIACKCPFCNEPPAMMVSDLSELVVFVPEPEDRLLWQYTFRRPIEVRGQKVVSVYYTLPRWHAWSQMSEGTSPKIVLPQACVCRINSPDGDDVQLSDTEMNAISKVDMEMLSEEISEVEAGPQLQIECVCAGCGRDFISSFNWNFDHFFGASSMPGRKKS